MTGEQSHEQKWQRDFRLLNGQMRWMGVLEDWPVIVRGGWWMVVGIEVVERPLPKPANDGRVACL